ncbi:hypothetical protein LCGC14_0654860 [marine sediment metagenome]|uniref:Nuclease associated modular domain-containing protein n=1 Tax=marine sediment metagenome TaxID=412755 RepID=A0A0F9R0E8_9ZZZZ
MVILTMRKATDEQLIESYTRLGNVWKVAAELGMCGQSVWERIKRLGFENKHKWTEVQLTELREAYSVSNTAPINLAALALRLGRANGNVCRKARELGLTSRTRKKTIEFCQAVSIRTKEQISKNGHPRGAYKTGKNIRVCPICGIFFEVFPSEPQRYCSIKCGHNHSQSQGSQGYANTGRRGDLGGQYFRSSWEANYARYLNYRELKWEYEPDIFEFKKIKKGQRFYTPDFKVYFTDGHIEYHEVKGWDYPKGRDARKRFAKYYPHLKLVLIDKVWFKAIKKQGVDELIHNWEGGEQMPRSELSKKMTKVIETADKLVSDIRKNTQNLTEALKELRELKKGRDEEEKSE